MKILMVNKFLYSNGGSETYMLNLGAKLEALGHEVQYFGMYDEKNIVGNDCEAYVPNVNFALFNGNVLEKVKKGIETVYSRATRKAIGKVLENFKPDIVHLNNINFQLTPSLIYEVKEHGMPIVQTVHDVQIACPCHRFYIEHRKQICEQCAEGTYWHCIKNKCVKNSMIKSILASVESYYYHTRDTYNLIDRYICPSQFIGEKIVNAGIKPEKIEVIYNFAEKVAKEYNTDVSQKYAIYFGRFSEEKGIVSLLNIAASIPDFHLVVAGRGPLEAYVEGQAKKLPNVEFVGFKTGQELQKLISGAVFSIYPSEWYENCPLSVIESQALGTPVIGSDLGGTKELIESGKTGMLFRGCDNKALKSVITELWNNEELVAKMSEQCSNVSQMDIAEYTNYMLHLYHNIIKERGK